MAEIPAGAKKPDDRKTKSKDEPVPERFTFTDDDGNEHELGETSEKITPGFMRKHRSSDAAEVLYAALELVADEDDLKLLDSLSWTRNAAVLKEFDDYIDRFFKASLGD